MSKDEHYESATCCSRGKRIVYFEKIHFKQWFLGYWDGSGFRSEYMHESVNYCPFCGKKLGRRKG